MREAIKKLLEDGVVISKIELSGIEKMFETNPNLEEKVVKIHELALNKEYDVRWEVIGLNGEGNICYEMGVPDEEKADKLLSEIESLGLKTKDIMIVLEILNDCSFIFL
jgi:DNA-binding Lrp family transcriptional regulator